MSKPAEKEIKKEWLLAGKVEPPFSLEDRTESFVEILFNRGIKSKKEAENFLESRYQDLADPDKLEMAKKAAEIVLEAKRTGKKIVIYGDYDVDGVCATALLSRFFTLIGIKHDYYIPDRDNEGYGLNKSAIDKIVKSGGNILLTVDCGIVNFLEVDYAKQLGLMVIITDHHLPKKDDSNKVTLPSAEVVINPKLQSEELPFYYLCGAGVAYYLVRMILSLDKTLLSVGQEKWLLDLVAIATICDIVPLTGDNRILAKYGLVVIKKTKNKGIKELAKSAELNVVDLNSQKIGFIIGPRINAAGRLEEARKAFLLLTTDDSTEASNLAKDLSKVNEERQRLTESIVLEAKEMIEKGDKDNKIIFLGSKKWPAGVVGIAASRLLDEYNKPVLIMEDDGGICKGSARSIDGFDIVSALEKCSKYLTNFGGHKKAAGFSFPSEHFVILDNKLIEISKKEIKQSDLTPKIKVDCDITNKKVVQKLAGEIELLEPFGPGNPRPVLLLNMVEVVDQRLVGNPPIHTKMTLKDQHDTYQGIYFNYSKELNRQVDLVFTLDKNVWNGKTKIDLKVIDIK